MYITKDNINLIKLELENMKKGLELAPKIKEVIKSFDNKVYSIRLSNKLNEINNNIYASLDNMDYLKIQYYYENRCVKSTTSESYIYTRNHELCYCFCGCTNLYGRYINGLKEGKRINAQYIISEIESWEAYRIQEIESIENELNNLEDLEKDFLAWYEAKKKLESHHHTIRDYFEIKTY